MMIMGHLLHHISPAFPISKPTPKFSCKFSIDCINNIDKYSTIRKIEGYSSSGAAIQVSDSPFFDTSGVG